MYIESTSHPPSFAKPLHMGDLGLGLAWFGFV